MENDPTDGQSTELVLGGTPHTVGSFRYFARERRWEWSEEVAAIHGYRPGEVSPTTQFLLDPKHPDDRGGGVRYVLVIGDQMLDQSGAVTGTEGFYVDLSDGHDHELKETTTTSSKRRWTRRSRTSQRPGPLSSRRRAC